MKLRTKILISGGAIVATLGGCGAAGQGGSHPTPTPRPTPVTQQCSMHDVVNAVIDSNLLDLTHDSTDSWVGPDARQEPKLDPGREAQEAQSLWVASDHGNNDQIMGAFEVSGACR